MSDTSPVMSELADPTDIELTFERLRGGEVFVELREESVASRAAALEALLRRVAEDKTKLIWISNPLRSPLTIERVFLQAAGPEADLRFDRSPAELATMLQTAADGAARCLMIVQQPETLDPEARDTLARIAPLLIDATPTVQFLFCGTSAFRPIKPVAVAPASSSLPESLPALIPEPRTSREKLPLLLLLLIAGLGSVIPFQVTEPTSRIARATQGTQTASATPPHSTIVAPTGAERPTPQVRVGTRDGSTNPPLAIDTAALRREFDTFLAQQSPSMPNLTQDQRDALFDEFLARQQTRTIQKRL